jgi:hypothetical protein
VEVMSVELEEATLKVNDFQKQCEEYLVVIVQQKREADEQQKVSLFQVHIPVVSLEFQKRFLKSYKDYQLNEWKT